MKCRVEAVFDSVEIPPEIEGMIGDKPSLALTVAMAQGAQPQVTVSRLGAVSIKEPVELDPSTPPYRPRYKDEPRIGSVTDFKVDGK